MSAFVHTAIVMLLLGGGVLLMVIAGIGLIRMPDFYLRASAASKAATLGVVLVMLATALHFGELGSSGRALAVISFMLLTAPVAAHLLGRTAYQLGLPLWQPPEGTGK